MLKQRKQAFPVAQVLGWADTLLDALAYLHQEGVIHRDIKPSNIKLTPRGQIILLDFGLAKGGITRQTLVGRSIYGYTPGYGPPEQIEGEGTDERSDLYALGATLYALLTAQTPDDPISRRKYIKRGYPDPLLPANQVNPQVPLHVAHTLQQAMALERTQRPANASQMRAMLNAPQRQPIAPAVSTTPPTSAHSVPLFTQTPSHSAPVTTPSAPLSSASTSNNNRLPLFLGLIMAAVLLIGVLLGSYIVGNGGEGGEATNVVEPEPAPTEAIAVQPTEVPTEPPPTEAPPTETATLTPTATPPPTETATLALTATPPPAATPTLGAGATAIAQTDGMVQVYVPEGDFEMGSADDDPDADDDEKPRHTVYLDAFWIDQTEVTNAMFAEFVAKTGYQTDAEKKNLGWAWDGSEWNKIEAANWQHPQGPESDLNGLSNHPVIQVSWYDATAYCEWAERRLPTEAEWEKAGAGIDGRKWPWGNDEPDDSLANFSHDVGETTPVGSYSAGISPYGVLDMAGNVREWVSDSYDSNYYTSSPRENPQGPSLAQKKVLRGGSWLCSASCARVRYRARHEADFRTDFDGFRCARSEK